MAAVQAKPINPLLASYLLSLATRPLLTKAVTSGTLSFLQEIVASKVTGSPSPPIESTGIAPIDAIKRNKKAFKLAAYGFFISAPLSHTLVGILQRQFAGRTDGKSKLLQILASNFLISPIIVTAYLASMCVINGGRSLQAIIEFVRLGFGKAFRVGLITNPLSLLFAQRFLSPEAWVPFFSFISFLVGTKINIDIKRANITARAKSLAAKKEAEGKGL